MSKEKTAKNWPYKFVTWGYNPYKLSYKPISNWILCPSCTNLFPFITSSSSPGPPHGRGPATSWNAFRFWKIDPVMHSTSFPPAAVIFFRPPRWFWGFWGLWIASHLGKPHHPWRPGDRSANNQRGYVVFVMLLLAFRFDLDVFFWCSGYLVGGFFPTHLKKMRKSKWIMKPQFSGWK